MSTRIGVLIVVLATASLDADIVCIPETLEEKFKASDVVFMGFLEKREVLNKAQTVFGEVHHLRFTFGVYTYLKGTENGKKMVIYDIVRATEVVFRPQTRYLLFASRHDRRSEMMKIDGWNGILPASTESILISNPCRTGILGQYGTNDFEALKTLSVR